ncbi:MAG TPA: CopG family antitoxin [Pyrinomonadaceae bacterium]|nr:CopG family antitoxin [Pyrinomonadaceae bacterium]HMP66627.1 CopG family antitoxin [Pyrinomonadaceae bacterium]
MKRKHTITADEFDEKFDNGEDISEYVDWSSARRINEEPQRVNVDFPKWVVQRLDREANRLGVSRQALLKIWIAERLEKA